MFYSSIFMLTHQLWIMEFMEPASTVYEICSWISISIAVPTTLYILYREHNKRNAADIKSPSKWLDIFSYLCIAVGPIYPLVLPLRHIKSLCSISVCISVTMVLQALFMEYFQLGRLHYCFSADQVHSNNGYPRWLFIFMFIIVTLSALMFLVSSTILQIPIYCHGDYDIADDEHLRSATTLLGVRSYMWISVRDTPKWHSIINIYNI